MNFARTESAISPSSCTNASLWLYECVRAPVCPCVCVCDSCSHLPACLYVCLSLSVCVCIQEGLSRPIPRHSMPGNKHKTYARQFRIVDQLGPVSMDQCAKGQPVLEARPNTESERERERKREIHQSVTSYTSKIIIVLPHVEVLNVDVLIRCGFAFAP